MARDANYIYKLVTYLVNKWEGGEPSPTEINDVVTQANASYQAFLIGEVTQQQYGRPISRVELGNNSHIYESLSPFILSATLTIASGLATLPADFQTTVNMSTTNGQDIRFVQKDSWFSWVNSVIDPVSTNPIYSLDKIGFRFAPLTLANATLTYIQKAPDFVWNFTLDGDGRPVYDPTGSVGLLWLDRDVFQVVSRSLSLVGINLQAQMVEQFSNQIKQAGQ